MTIPRTVQAGEQVGMLSAASMRTKRAKNVLREIKMREERDIVGSMWAKKNVTDTTQILEPANGPGAGRNLGAQGRGCLPNPEIEDQRASGRHARQERASVFRHVPGSGKYGARL